MAKWFWVFGHGRAYDPENSTPWSLCIQRHVDADVEVVGDGDVEVSPLGRLIFGDLAAHLGQHRDDAPEQFQRPLMMFVGSCPERERDVQNGSALHRGTSGNRIVTRGIPWGGASGAFGHVQRYRNSCSSQLFLELGVAARKLRRDL